MNKIINTLFALVVIAVGALWIADVYEWISIDMSWFHNIKWGQIWIPLLIIFVGIKMLCNAWRTRSNREHRHHDFKQTEPSCKCEVMFGGRDMSFAGQRFSGISIKAFFGGVKVDLTDAEIEDNAVINVQTLFGGTEIFVPKDVAIDINSSCLLGGVGDERRRSYDAATKTIHVNANCLFGGAAIK